MLKKLFVSVLVLSVFASCLKDKATGGFTCTFDTCSIKAPVSEIQSVQAYLSGQGLTNAVQHCSGVFYTVIAQGTGNAITPCSAIVATYTGKLTNGNTFDQGTFQQYIPLQQLVTGWTNTIPMLKVGGKIKLYIPPSLGYGSRTGTAIPPNSILIFDVEVVAAQ
ncbi:MAG: FKBP-type peptidylprolyl isomerase [Flaviaesturariibacter sp.]|nr:FKBP-type peptidylprolyl isomerase [Flaviaesturariibacter sp.]